MCQSMHALGDLVNLPTKPLLWSLFLMLLQPTCQLVIKNRCWTNWAQTSSISYKNEMNVLSCAYWNTAMKASKSVVGGTVSTAWHTKRSKFIIHAQFIGRIVWKQNTGILGYATKMQRYVTLTTNDISEIWDSNMQWQRNWNYTRTKYDKAPSTFTTHI